MGPRGPHWARPEPLPPDPGTEGPLSPPWSSPAWGAKTWRQAEVGPRGLLHCLTHNGRWCGSSLRLRNRGLSHGATFLGRAVLSVVRGCWPCVRMGHRAPKPRDLTPRPADPSRPPGHGRAIPGPPGPPSGLLPASDSRPPGSLATVWGPWVPKSKQTPGANQEPAGRRPHPQGAGRNVPLGRARSL